MDIRKLKPNQKGMSDKYSWNLYQFLKTNKDIRVFWDSTNDFNKRSIRFIDKDSTDVSQHLRLGRFLGKSFAGRSLMSVLVKTDKHLYSYSWLDANQLEDVTDWFFDTYEKIGRCAFDNNHSMWLSNEDGRYEEFENKKKCCWCGSRFEKKIKEVATKSERWVKI